ncbi:hypothetical protein COU79_05500 [Candidatus Peregrinibacteria bacterium CG10_big_fil_rev_8_21_14_0_10_54_7]|nr:MAG: hypothetical protein COU79_05500 [Candidatus Peregrinibacteria bacterium CG10_big_fil_rev_8_21_14_0_10_54_7]
MGSFIINLLLVIGGFLLIKFRERIADTFGEAYWMRYVGGIYMFVVIIGVLMFFFGLARMTGTTKILMAPIYSVFPKTIEAPPPTF